MTPLMAALGRRALIHAAALVCAAGVLSGCAGYSLGPTNGMTAGSRSITIAPIQNRTLEPRLAEAATHALRKQIQQDGTFQLATQERGSILVTTTLTDYKRQPLSFQPNDVIATRDYLVRLTAQVVATENGTGRTLINRPVTARTTVRSVEDQATMEREMLPVLAEDLARNITALLVDGNW